MYPNGNGTLKLYFFPVSFYSQRALLTLYEKGLSFEPVVVNIHAEEQYQPWYARLNPNCAVPTLQDGVKVIPDSTCIMEYLEDNFSNGKFRRLMPLDKSSDVYSKVTSFMEAFNKLNIGVFTYGTFFRPEFRPDVRMPQTVVKKLVNKTKRREGETPSFVSVLERTMREVPETREALQKKMGFLDTFTKSIADPERHEQAYREVDAFLQKVEDELVTHTGDRANWWLCGPEFTLADVDLCVLLGRIWALGQERRLFVNTRPHVASYFRRSRRRATVQRVTALPLRLRALLAAEKLASYLPLLLGVGALVAAAVYGIKTYRR